MHENILYGGKILFDFDSTLVRGEGLEIIAERALVALPKKMQSRLIQEIEVITQMGMEGQIDFQESLQKRLALLEGRVTREIVEEVAEEFTRRVSAFFLHHQEFLHRKAQDIYIISGGFEEFILPTAMMLGFLPEHIFANKFIFDSKGQLISYEKDRLLAGNAGKVAQTRLLGLNPEKTIMVGDGSTDRAVKEAGLASYFFAFTENVQRQGILSSKDSVVIADGTHDDLEVLIHAFLKNS